MARNASSKKAKKTEPEYTLGYDADGNVVLVPNVPDTAPARSPFARISEGAMEGYGYQPLGMSEKDIAEYPTAARYLNPIAKALDAVRRAPGAIAGGLAGAAGTGAELWTGDRGVANEAQRAVASALEYGGNQGMATMGGPRPGANQAAVSGKIIPPERGAPRQLGFTEKPIVDIRRELPPGVIRAGSAEGLPRLTYEDPLTRYRLASEQGQRIGPRRPSEAFRPMMDEMYTVPEQLNRTPETTRPSSAARYGDESPQQAERAGVNRAAYEEFLADLRAADEARATNEGMPEPGTRPPAAPVAPPPARPMTAPALPESNVPAWQARPAPGIRRAAPAEAPSPAQPTFDFGGPQSVGGQMVDPLTGRAFMPRRFDQAAPQPTAGSFSPFMRAEALVPEPVNLDAMLGRPPTVQDNVQNAINIAKQRSDAMARSAADAAAQQAAIDAGVRQVKGERARGPYQRSQSANSLIDQAIADVTGQAPPAAAPASAPAAAGPASGPWGAVPQSSKGLPPGSTYTPSTAAAPVTPVAPVSGVPTPMGWGDKALIGGSLGALGLAGATVDRDNRRQQKALEAAQSRLRIDDMDEAAFRAARSGTNAQRRQIPVADADSITAGYDLVPTQRRQIPAADADSITAGYNLSSQRPPAVMGGNAPAQQRPASAAPAGGGSFLDKIFSGKDYQSSGGLLQQQQDGKRVLNWGDSDNAADFFRADAMRKRLEDQQQQFTGRSGSDIEYENRMASEGKARGGAAEQKPSKEAMLHKSLEIIHHMIKNR